MLITRSLTKVKRLTTGVLLLCFATSQAQTLNDYVSEGLTNNLVLKQKNITLQQAALSLQMAKSHFLPTVSVLADYTSGQGGRSIGIPIGDMLNPVYTSLNQLTHSDEFPEVENVKQSFFPRNFHDIRVRTSIPLVNTDLYIHRDIQSQQVMMQQYEAAIFKRQLVYEIKNAFYTLLTAQAAVSIYESALQLVERNLQTNESLFRNGKSLHANVLRTKSELEKVKAELNNAQNQVINARQYFNFLLNRDLNKPVNTPTLESMPIVIDSSEIAVERREEIRMIHTAREINHSELRMSTLSRLPKVSAFLDLGTQSEGWKYDTDSRYYLVGVQLSLPIFQGFRNDKTIRQNRLELEKTDAHLINTTRQLELAATAAANRLKTTLANYRAAQDQLNSAEAYFKLVDKGFREGVSSLIEFLDARNQLTASALQLTVRQLEVLTAQAQVERETAAYSL